MQCYSTIYPTLSWSLSAQYPSFVVREKIINLVNKCRVGRCCIKSHQPKECTKKRREIRFI